MSWTNERLAWLYLAPGRGPRGDPASHPSELQPGVSLGDFLLLASADAQPGWEAEVLHPRGGERRQAGHSRVGVHQTERCYSPDEGGTALPSPRKSVKSSD